MTKKGCAGCWYFLLCFINNSVYCFHMRLRGAQHSEIAVIVFPTPGELKIRCDKRFKEMGKDVLHDAVNEMLANYILPKSKDMPGSDEVFDEVIFTAKQIKA